MHVYQLVGNSTGWLQVHDVSVYKATQGYYRKALSNWKKKNPGSSQPGYNDFADMIWYVLASTIILPATASNIDSFCSCFSLFSLYI
jgi:hypothetical protein